jgi:hypothetical protein
MTGASAVDGALHSRDRPTQRLGKCRESQRDPPRLHGAFHHEECVGGLARAHNAARVRKPLQSFFGRSGWNGATSHNARRSASVDRRALVVERTSLHPNKLRVQLRVQIVGT